MVFKATNDNPCKQLQVQETTINTHIYSYHIP